MQPAAREAAKGSEMKRQAEMAGRGGAASGRGASQSHSAVLNWKGREAMEATDALETSDNMQSN